MNFENTERTMTSCGAHHDCGGVCWQYNIDGVWHHHCDRGPCRYREKHEKKEGE